MTDDPWNRNEIKVQMETFPALDDYMQTLSRKMVARMLEPWKYPDRPKMPDFEPFPRLNNLALKAARRQRQAATIWNNLHHLTEPRQDDY